MAEARESSLLDHSEQAIPDAGDGWLRAIPARWAVGLLLDRGGRPLQLLAMKNLREAVRHRMEQQESPTRRVNWRELLGEVRWRRVDSDFEADWVCLEAAREYFPDNFDEWVRWGETWFVHVDPDARFPRYAKTTNWTDAPGLWLGPLPDGKAAARLIELVEDAFDLCRYHSILVQYPHGAACAYKEMGKCPAPCDGSIGIEQYQRLIDLSIAGLIDSAGLMEEQRCRMQQAAAELRFEIAVRIKSHIETLRQFGQGVLRHARPLREFAFVTVQPGPKPGRAKVFLILPGSLAPVACLIDEPDDLAAIVLAEARRRGDGEGRDAMSGHRIGLAARHLFSTKKSRGVFIGLADLTDAALRAAYRQVSRRPPATADAVDVAEG